MNELEVRTAIYACLDTDAALTALLSEPHAIHHEVAPSIARFPYVIVQRMAGMPVWQFQGGRYDTDLWLVKAVDRSSSASVAQAIAKRIDELLTDAPLAVAGHTLLGVWRETDVSFPELDDGGVIRHAGANFRLITEPA